MAQSTVLPFTGRLRVRPQPTPTTSAAFSSSSSSSSSSSRGRGVQTCSRCGFGTRHRVLFERHARRCQHGLRPPQVVARNYRCSECPFTTTCSKMHLVHLKARHGQALSIFPCDLCDYASRYKCKVLRHRRFVHRAAAPLDADGLQEMEVMDKADLEALEAAEARLEENNGKQEQEEAEEKEMEVVQEEPQSKGENGDHDGDNGIDGIHEMEQDDLSDVEAPLINAAAAAGGDELQEDGTAGSGAESDSAGNIIGKSVPSIRSPIKSTDNAFDYIERVTSSSPEGQQQQQAAYQCRLCTYASVQKWKVANHVRSFHMKKKVFKCSSCDFVTSRKIEFCIHKKTHTEKVWQGESGSGRPTQPGGSDQLQNAVKLTDDTTETPAAVASASLDDEDEALADDEPQPLTIVLSTSEDESLVDSPETDNGSMSGSVEHLSQDIACGVCGLKVKNESKLRIHMVSHSTESVHWCPLCTLKYKRSSDLNRHMKRKHGARLRDFFFMGQQEQPLNLSVSPRSDPPPTISNPRSQVASRRPSAGAGEGDEQPLDLSLPKAAGTVPAENLKCSHCSYLAKWPSDLRRHLLVHSVEKRYKCPCCHRKYKYQFDLNMHLRRMHRVPAGRTKVVAASAAAPSSSAPPVVNVATLQSSSVMTLKSEESGDDGRPPPASHSSPSPGGKPLRVNRYKLTRQQVSPQGKYKCDYCPYLGKYQSEVERHMRLHTGEKPYSCLFCAYRSHWRGDMKRHLQKHHVGEPGVADDITALMERTYQPHAPPDQPTANGQPGDQLLHVKDEPADGEGDQAEEEEEEEEEEEDDDDMEEDEEEAEEAEAAQIKEERSGDAESDTPETLTLTPCSSSSGSTMTAARGSGDRKQNLCPYCPFTCEAPSKLKCHMEIHENLKRFKCAHCGKRSNWTWDVRKHIKKEHPGQALSVIELAEDEARQSLHHYLQTHHKVATKRLEPPCDRLDLPTQVPLNRITDHLPPIDAVTLAPLPRPPDRADHGEEGEEEAAAATATGSGLAASVQSRHPSIATKRCRPFKCSRCGRRSNWKWDMNKHIRNVHPQAKLIILSPEEARATMPKGGFKNASSMAVSSGGVGGVGGGSGSVVGRRDLLRVNMAPVIKAETAAVTAGSGPKPKHNHQFDSNRTKKFKCSACPYRSDYRSDIGRHLKRLHQPGSASILMLSDEEARASLQEYKDRWVRGKFVFSPAKEKMYAEVDRQNAARRLHQNPTSPPTAHTAGRGRVVAGGRWVKGPTTPSATNRALMANAERAKRWKCPKCSYQNPNKKMVIRHMRAHPKVKVFQCRLCGEASDFRNSMYRHVRARHATTDYSGVVVESVAFVTTVVRPEVPDDAEPGEDDDDGAVPLTFRCKVCGQTSSWRSGILRHLAEHHPGQGGGGRGQVEVVRVSQVLPALPQQVTDSGVVFAASADDAKQLRCDVCPYRTNKSGLLKIHKTYHRPQPSNKFKCKYCPYYVSAMRLLHQHVRLHLHQFPLEANNNNTSPHHPHHHGATAIKSDSVLQHGNQEEEEEDEDGDNESSLVVAPPSGGAGGASQGRRYYCDQCPAVSRNKNDYLYHKQFHRPKPSAPFKCRLCNYWVSQRRLLRQHERVHLAEYIEHYHHNNNNSPKPDVLKTYADRGGGSAGNGGAASVPQMVLASPAKSDVSDFGDPVHVAALKQQIIASKVTTVPITPDKLGGTGTYGYKVDVSGRYLGGGPLRTLVACSHCPFSSVRSAAVRRHEALHGFPPSAGAGRPTEKCPYCTFNAPNKKLLANHIKVHSSSYRPGVHVINDVDPKEDGDHDDEDEEREGQQQQEVEEDEGVGSGSEAGDRKSATGAGAAAAEGASTGGVLDLSCLPPNQEYYVKYNDSTGQHLLERAHFKKWCCEKCPYATMKRAQFERHITLHASGQKYVCDFCDYSVPAYHLLLQHKKLHLHPNPNLLTAQSIANLTRLPTLPADVAAATSFPSTAADPASQHDRHDAADLYENSADFSEPKKLYRCDRCPYTNVRRDHLLSHLRFHMVPSEFPCSYCDYSVSKQHLLVQHIKVHFTAPGSDGFNTPNPALRDPPASAAGGGERKVGSAARPSAAAEKTADGGGKDGDDGASQPEYIDIAELTKAGLLKVKQPTAKAGSQDGKDHLTQGQVLKKKELAANKKEGESAKAVSLKVKEGSSKAGNKDEEEPTKGSRKVQSRDVSMKNGTDEEEEEQGDDGEEEDDAEKEAHEDKNKNTEDGENDEDEAMEVDTKEIGEDQHGKVGSGEDTRWVCQYCDRIFKTSEEMLQHESQHLVGSHY